MADRDGRGHCNKQCQRLEKEYVDAVAGDAGRIGEPCPAKPEQNMRADEERRPAGRIALVDLERKIPAGEKSPGDIHAGRNDRPGEHVGAHAGRRRAEGDKGDKKHDRGRAGQDCACVCRQQLRIEPRIGDALFGQTVARFADSLAHIAVAIGLSPVNNCLVGEFRRKLTHDFNNLRFTRPAWASRLGE